MPQTPALPIAAAASVQPFAPATTQVAAHQPTLALRAPRAAQELGLAIARRASEGGDELVVRMDPAELGRIHVRMSFDEQGTLRAAIVADNPGVMEAMRRDSADLARAIGDAGVKADAQSFRFDRGDQQGGSPHPQRPLPAFLWDQDAAADIPVTPLRASAGRVNLIA